MTYYRITSTKWQCKKLNRWLKIIQLNYNVDYCKVTHLGCNYSIVLYMITEYSWGTQSLPFNNKFTRSKAKYIEYNSIIKIYNKIEHFPSRLLSLIFSRVLEDSVVFLCTNSNIVIFIIKSLLLLSCLQNSHGI